MSKASAPAETALRQSRLLLLTEFVVVTGAALAAVFWVIPMQTTDGGFGLSPAFIPTYCAAAIGAFAGLDVVVRLARGTPEACYPAGWTAFLRIGAVAVLGTLVLSWAGLAICALVTVPVGMLVLGERRPLYLFPITLASAAAVWLAFG